MTRPDAAWSWEGMATRVVVAVLGAAMVVWASVAAAQQTEPGRQAFRDAGCASCHGPSAQGGTAPALRGTTRSFAEFLKIVREGFDEMPARPPSELSDEQIALIHQWLVQLPGRS